MSRDWWGDDEPDEHGGRRPFRPDANAEHVTNLGGWSVADTITITLLLLLLAAVTVVLVAVTVTGGYCPAGEEVAAQVN